VVGKEETAVDTMEGAFAAAVERAKGCLVVGWGWVVRKVAVKADEVGSAVEEELGVEEAAEAVTVMAAMAAMEETMVEVGATVGALTETWAALRVMEAVAKAAAAAWAALQGVA